MCCHTTPILFILMSVMTITLTETESVVIELCVCVYMCGVGGREGGKRHFPITFPPFTALLEIYEMHRESQAFAENQNNVKEKMATNE